MYTGVDHDAKYLLMNDVYGTDYSVDINSILVKFYKEEINLRKLLCHVRLV